MSKPAQFDDPRTSPEHCPVRGVIADIGDKWSVLVILHLHGADHRFSELRRKIPDVSQRMLTMTLRKLERDGLVWRRVTPSTPPQVTYGITPLGQSLTGQFEILAQWAKTNRKKIDAARAAFDRREG